MFTVAAFYRFVLLAQPAVLREEFRAAFDKSDLLGTMLIAGEGVNGTMAASSETIDRLLKLLEERIGLDRTDVKFSNSEFPPFKRLKFKVKREIITFREARADPTRPGTYVQPQEWNELMADANVLLLDTRNRYESEIGTFHGATIPAIDTFSEFATYVRENLDPAKTPKVAMFCTGGIRCEKASAFMLGEGFREVYHLKGGILKYLEETPKQASKWQGDCYIFDDRTSLGHGDFKD